MCAASANHRNDISVAPCCRPDRSGDGVLRTDPLKLCRIQVNTDPGSTPVDCREEVDNAGASCSADDGNAVGHRREQELAVPLQRHPCLEPSVRADTRSR
jgi:hypothetical protein